MASPSLRSLFPTFARIGLLSFGGPAAQIALMHRVLVDENRWLSEETFLRALSFCMLLPGPEAMQLATYAGWRLRGIRGGLMAGLLFVLPGALVILALGLLYLRFGTLPLVSAAFLGIKASVAVIVVEALLRVGRRALKSDRARAIALIAFGALVLLKLPFPLVIVAAAIFGALRIDTSNTPPAATRAALGPTLLHLALGIALWLAPIGVAALAGSGFLTTLGLFFGKLALVSFGGAYALLTYMTQSLVETHGWVTTGQMIDALGLAETTPGPLILVTAFVALLAGASQGGAPMALAAFAMALWATFVPSFLWIFAFAPHIEALTGRPRLRAALDGISAAVVGVIGALALWFTLHVLFSSVTELRLGPLTLPRVSGLNLPALAILILSGWLLLRRHLALGWVLFIAAIAGILAAILPPALAAML